MLVVIAFSPEQSVAVFDSHVHGVNGASAAASCPNATARLAASCWKLLSWSSLWYWTLSPEVALKSQQWAMDNVLWLAGHVKSTSLAVVAAIMNVFSLVHVMDRHWSNSCVHLYAADFLAFSLKTFWKTNLKHRSHLSSRATSLSKLTPSIWIILQH